MKAEAATPAPPTTAGSKPTAPAGAPASGTEAPAPTQPQTLYCICRTPDETFMICCDRCEEWYHISCMGIKPVSKFSKAIVSQRSILAFTDNLRPI